ncbi:Hcp family type VI secretion system effector [Serratia rubidaea]|uniref:Hcp family type VI secretion system effector n=1 Tax=Serratia rubidaea TaxID=61652 RepID=UPI0022B9236C|nr:type VI secretion system tube protein Hcp [Serratia rubidaea]WBF47641.1 type VI secretion system tube protein Hcp [Serratia rubidaea]
MIQKAFIKINGIEGESRDLLHHGEIDVIRWRWRAEQALRKYKKDSNGLGLHTANGFVFEHYVDKSSQGMLHYCTSGKHIPEAVLTINTADGLPLSYLRITLQEIVIINIQSICYNTMHAPREKVELLFSRFMMDYVPQDKPGFSGRVVTIGYDVKSNQII